MIKNSTSKFKLYFKSALLVLLLMIVSFVLNNAELRYRLTHLIDTNNYDYQLEHKISYLGGSSTYLIQIDTKTKALSVKMSSTSSEPGVKDISEKYGPTILTNPEYDNIFLIINKKDKTNFDMDVFVNALESIARDDDSSIKDRGYNFGGYTIYRDYGNTLLNMLVRQEKNKSTAEQ